MSKASLTSGGLDSIAHIGNHGEKVRQGDACTAGCLSVVNGVDLGLLILSVIGRARDAFSIRVRDYHSPEVSEFSLVEHLIVVGVRGREGL